jgi:hypothetical protein
VQQNVENFSANFGMAGAARFIKGAAAEQLDEGTLGRQCSASSSVGDYVL